MVFNSTIREEFYCDLSYWVNACGRYKLARFHPKLCRKQVVNNALYGFT